LEDTADNLRVETQQGVIHMKNTAGSYTHEEHSREIHTWRTQQRI
jgi:hypothetical protein